MKKSKLKIGVVDYGKPLVLTTKLNLYDVSNCECLEEDRVEEDGELYCLKCNTKWD